MPGDEPTTVNERYEYLRKATRKERGQLLDHMEHVSGLNRKTLIRHVNRKEMKRRPRRKQRGKTWGHRADDA